MHQINSGATPKKEEGEEGMGEKVDEETLMKGQRQGGSKKTFINHLKKKFHSTVARNPESVEFIFLLHHPRFPSFFSFGLPL